MAGPCPQVFTDLAGQLGDFGCEGANAVVNLHNPFGLDHWTMLVVEVATVAGAVLALRHALRRRRVGDPSALAIWIAAVAYLFVVEPPLYFPHEFGLDEQVGLIFVHNQFTVNFLFDRLPIYILAFYPVLATLTFELVRVLGVFERRGPVVSALCVGLTYHLFYEFFDHVGPQLRWWIWNPDAPTNEPFLASVPISSMVNFAVAGPVALAFLVLVLVTRHPQASTMPTGTLLARGAFAGVLMPLGLVLGGLPATVFALDGTPDHTAQGLAYWAVLAVVAVVAVPAMVDARRHRGGPPTDPGDRRYLATHAAVYLGAMTVGWLAALPGYFGATDGITADGTPTGSLAYAVACLAGSLAITWMALRRRTPEPAAPEPELVVS